MSPTMYGNNLLSLAGRAEKSRLVTHMHGMLSHALQRETACLHCRFHTEEAATEAHDLAAIVLNGAVAETIFDEFSHDRCAQPALAL